MTRRPVVDADLIPRRCLDIRIRKVRGKLLLSGGKNALELDEVAMFIFGQVDGAASVRQIAQRVATEYDVSLDEATADSAELLAGLVEEGVVTMTGARDDAPEGAG